MAYHQQDDYYSPSPQMYNLLLPPVESNFAGTSTLIFNNVTSRESTPSGAAFMAHNHQEASPNLTTGVGYDDRLHVMSNSTAASSSSSNTPSPLMTGFNLLSRRSRSSQSQPQHVQLVESVISNASADQLLRFGNPAFRELHNEMIAIRAQYLQLQTMYSALTSQLMGSQHTNQIPSMAASPYYKTGVVLKPERAESQPPMPLRRTGPLPRREDYPDVMYWTKDDFVGQKEEPDEEESKLVDNRRSTVAQAIPWLQHANGRFFTAEESARVKATVREALERQYPGDNVPHTVRLTRSIRPWFHSFLVSRHPELELCEGDLKTYKALVLVFASWRQYNRPNAFKRDREAGLGRKPNSTAAVKRKATEPPMGVRPSKRLEAEYADGDHSDEDLDLLSPSSWLQPLPPPVSQPPVPSAARHAQPNALRVAPAVPIRLSDKSIALPQAQKIAASNDPLPTVSVNTAFIPATIAPTPLAVPAHIEPTVDIARVVDSAPITIAAPPKLPVEPSVSDPLSETSKSSNGFVLANPLADAFGPPITRTKSQILGGASTTPPKDASLPVSTTAEQQTTSPKSSKRGRGVQYPSKKTEVTADNIFKAKLLNGEYKDTQLSKEQFTQLLETFKVEQPDIYQSYKAEAAQMKTDGITFATWKDT